MSLTPSAASAPRRVRHQARDAVVVMVFSASASTAVAGAFLLLGQLSRTGR
ncbi:MAG: hypothetical protein QM747_18795 [Nocardioides sp.]